MINKLAQEIHEYAKGLGVYDNPPNIPEKLCLIHSEVSEAMEADRKGKYANIKQFNIDRQSTPFHEISATIDSFEINIKNTFEDELADIMIRVMDLAAWNRIDLEKHINLKMEYNKIKPNQNGKKY